jgi:ATP-binding cassette, subfamily C, bacteriocin exporter
LNKFRNTFVRQQGRSDCGVACLASIIKYYNGESSLERLRQLSGTSQQGTTLLGLYQAATQLGFEAEGLKAESIDNLTDLLSPCILHVLIDNKLQHYLVFYGFNKKGCAIIGDPGQGIVEYTRENLIKIWQTKTLLKLTPNQNFVVKEADLIEKRKWLIELIREDFNILFIALIFGVIISILGLSTIVFSQKLIDVILPSGNKQNLIFGLIAVGLLLFIRNVFVYVRGVFLMQQAVDFNSRIIHKFYSKLLHLPKLFFDTRKTGELIARMNDTRRLQSTISSIFGSIIIDILQIVASLILIFIYSVNIGFIVLGGVPLLGFLTLSFNSKIITSQKSVMSSYADIESHYVDTIQGISTIKSTNKEPFFGLMNKQIFDFFQSKIFTLGKLNLRFSFLSETVGIILTLMVLTSSTFMVLSKNIQVGEMVALLTISSSIIPALNRVVISNIQLQEARIAFDRMYEFTSIKPEYDHSYESSHPLIESRDIKLINISFRFPGRKQLLQDVSVELKSNEIVALLGESGSGKSTIIQLLQKFYTPESGKILYGDILLDSLPTKHWRCNLGVVSQDIKIFNGSLLYNITLSNAPEDFEAAVRFCKLYDFDFYFKTFPQGYLTILGEDGVNISGGQKQLVAIVRALFRKPKILLLDEATSGMDRNTENFILDIITQLKSKMSTLMVTHKIKTAQQADKIYILENGKITTFGKPNELMVTKNLFSESIKELTTSEIRHTL